RVDNISGKTSEILVFYSTSDINAYEAAIWLRENYEEQNIKVVAMEKPGTWFGIYSDKPIIAQTDRVVEWNVKAESVLDLSYEILNPLTMYRAYQSNGVITEENFIYHNMVWTRISYFAANTASITFRDSQDDHYTYALCDLSRTITIDNSSQPVKIVINYSNEQFSLIQTTSVMTNTYPLTTTWQFTALNEDLHNVKLSLNYNFEPSVTFNNTYIPSILNWENPWDNFSRSENGWAITSFSEAIFSGDKFVSVYSKANQTAFGIKFVDVPTYGNVGVLSDRKVDAIRFEYNIDQVSTGSPVSKTYQVLTFSQTSVPELTSLDEMNTLFEYESVEEMKVEYRDFVSIIQENNIGFVVYNKEQFNPSLLNSKVLQMIYANDKFIICKINL
ncbi:MAG: hypothetical protein GX638_17985, partial [Crenarchaeota archaeon]|nr:hypothetical protein [Thermoproteota archaeon]